MEPSGESSSAGDKRRNVIGALAFDKNRFSDRSSLYRVIIYTDGTVIDADLDAGADVTRQVNFLTTKYPASFFGADISIFGVSDSSDKNASLKRFPPDLNRRDSQRVRNERIWVH